jgi:hypothetical protein
MKARIDQAQTITTFPARETAQALADKITADDTVGDVLYVVEKNLRGYFVAVNDSETGDRVGTL